MDPSEYNKRGLNASRAAAEAARPGSAYGLEERLELLRARGVPQLPQGLGLDLADALAGHVEGPADLLEGVLGAVSDAEAHFQDLLLAGSQRLQHAPRLILEVRHQDR